MDEQTLRTLESLTGTQAAHVVLMEVLIATHPAPKLLRALWEQVRHDHVDKVTGLPHAHVSKAKDAYLARLAVLTQAIEQAAARD